MKLIDTDKGKGTRVTGNYLGMFPFAGTVANVRFAPSGYLYEIALDAAIQVFGEGRNSIQFYSGDQDALRVLVK